jgi:hypothetical protein
MASLQPAAPDSLLRRVPHSDRLDRCADGPQHKDRGKKRAAEAPGQHDRVQKPYITAPAPEEGTRCPK